MYDTNSAFFFSKWLVFFFVQSCDRGIASGYKVHKDARNIIAKDGVTITAEEVCLEQNCPSKWETFCRADPASVSTSAAHWSKLAVCSYLQILKEAISRQTEYDPGDWNLLSYIPRLELDIKKVPENLDSKPLELSVEGLNKRVAF